MATAQQSPDRVTSSDSTEALNVLILDATKKPADSELLKDQDMVTIGSQRDDAEHSGSISPGGGYKTTYSANAYSFHGQPLYNGGHDDTANVQGACLPYFHAEGLENGSYDVRSESPSLAFHGYGLRPLMPHRSYAHVTTQQPYMRGRGQLYDARNFSTSYPPYFQQTVPPNIPYIAPRTQVSMEKLPVDIDLQADGKQFWPRAYCPTLLGPSGRGSNLSGNSGELGFMHQGLEGSGVGGLQSDWSKLLNRKSSLFQLSASAAASKPIDSLELFENDFETASQQKRSFYGFGSSSRLSYRGYPHSRSDRGFSYGSLSCSNLGMNSVNWPTLDEARQGGRCNDFSCSCSVTLDTLSERNRGPRAFKPKGPTPVNGPTFDNSRNDTVFDFHGELYNRLDFVTEYKNAKFFVIKSYSEDNVHKSIKYGVWASTPNGNKKLDAAYREANEKPGRCPIFLFFSVNASAQFCGVAEMVGPVDFDKSVDYWLQDKWSGQFPVKWHLIKDVPNSQFRHIILENNDNKPVTNSRDTQEVELTQGVEMLNLFKKYETYSSILDDFYFYEERQKAMQERKARHQASPASAPVAVSSEQNPILGSSALVNKMSKSFAEALVLNDQK